jgi:aminoglycoside phosphotransferase (APT) family kinase protein
MTTSAIMIDETLVRRLIATQFPQWKDLPVRPVAVSGWDNRTFHLGENMLVRLPSSGDYALQVDKEQTWLPRLAQYLPLHIPAPLAVGEPGEGYSWKWSIYSWIEGDTVASSSILDLNDVAVRLARFITAMHGIDTSGGPIAGEHNFYRGGSLAIYDAGTRQAITALKGKVDTDTATELWEAALASHWQYPPVWIHGDISAGNLLMQEGKLHAVIDFGQLGIGDPACDLAIAWTLFHGESRNIFRAMLPLDADTWIRGRAWTLWKALITAADFTNPGNAESVQCWRIIDDVLEDYKGYKRHNEI